MIAEALPAIDQGTVRAAVDAFLVDLEGGGRTSGHIRSCRDKLNKFIAYCDSTGCELTEEVSPPTIRGFLQSRRQAGKTNNGLHAEARILRAFLRWGEKEELIRERVVRTLRMPRKETPIRDPFSPEQVRALLETARASDWRGRETYMPTRDVAIVMVLFDTGCRAGEVRNMKIGDLAGDSIAIRMAKNGNGRRVPISMETRRAIEEWLKHRESLLNWRSDQEKELGFRVMDRLPVWQSLFKTWHRTLGETPRTVAWICSHLDEFPELRDAMVLAMGDLIADSTQNTRRRRVLGSILAKHAGIFHGGVILEQAGKNGHTEAFYWRVRRISEAEAAVIQPRRIKAAPAWSPNLHRKKAWDPAQAGEWLFTSRDGRQLTRYAVYNLFKRLKAAGGIEGKCHPHMARRTVATEWIRSHGGLFELQQLLGHSSLEMVRYYAKIADVDVEEAHRTHGLIGRLGRGEVKG